MNIPDKIRSVRIECECDAFEAVYDEDGQCLNCHKPRPTLVVTYDCPAGCDKGVKDGETCWYCEGRGYSE